MNVEDIEINRGAVRPMECFREGWQLIKDNYWLFFGISFVGVLIGGMAPMAILVGPMMCGIYLCFLQQESGKPVKLDMLFQGFQFFVPGLVATLIMVVPIVLFVLVLYALMIVGMFALVGGPGNARRGPPPEELVIGLLSAYGVGLLLLIGVSIVLKAFFLFIYLLIVDKNVSGWDAVRLSFRAVWANLWGVLGLLLLSEFLGFVGLLFCGVGAYFEMPLSFAMFTIAYRQVFPPHDPFARFSELEDDEPDDDMEPSNKVEADTSVKVDSPNA